MAMPATAEKLDDGPETAVVSFRDLYDENVAFVWRTLRRYGVPEVAVADATQEVFVVVHARLATFEGRSSLRSWMFGIARRVARNYRAGRTLEVDAEHLEAIADLPSRSPQLTAEKLEAAAWLERRLDELSADKREAFILVDVEQMTLSEASAALGIARNTLYSRVVAARQHLEQALLRQRAAERWKTSCRD
jgi:RNA polymerase sigma-70 factor (ECF subfamily)